MIIHDFKHPTTSLISVLTSTFSQMLEIQKSQQNIVAKLADLKNFIDKPIVPKP